MSLDFLEISTSDSHYIHQISMIENNSFSIPWTMENFLFEVKNEFSFSFVLLLNESIVGYIFSAKVMEEIQLNKICIDSKERNKGFGTILLNKFIQKAYEQNYKKIFLEVNENNIAALKMYQKAGFKYNRIRKKIYDNINNGIEMILHLA